MAVSTDGNSVDKKQTIYLLDPMLAGTALFFDQRSEWTRSRSPHLILVGDWIIPSQLVRCLGLIVKSLSSVKERLSWGSVY